MLSPSGRNLHSYDLRLDIPARAMINAEILQSAESSGSLYAHKTIVQQKLDLLIDPREYHTLDQAHVASLLYCLFVVPREILDLQAKDDLFVRLDRLEPLQYFRIIQPRAGFEGSPSFWLLRALRNSVAHALYEIDAQNNWRFWTDREPRWEAKASKDDLTRFLSVFGREFANCCLARKARHDGSNT
ncbi:MAG TPA: hypothetical protein HPP77_03220 [Candidatus Hydrogenedentes bacterium]|nr:hypothetical protein [Candidatus Hydrogenedentota bacterium]